jgi:CRP/FNR family cyclic AMP-dependent transcriptional regulator
MAIAASLDFASASRKTMSPVSADPAADFAAAPNTSVGGASGGVPGSILGDIPALAGLPGQVLAALTSTSTVRRLSRRAILAQEGSVPSQVFVVLRGRVRAVRRSASGREVTLESFHAGDLLADGVVAADRPLMNDWEASEPTEVLAINREAFVAQLQALPSLALTVAAQMLSRLERSKQLAGGLALADVPDRVVAALRLLAATQGESGPDGVVVSNRPTQQEMANSIGACRETVSRVVSDLARRGLVTPRGRTLVISQRLLDTIA